MLNEKDLENVRKAAQISGYLDDLGLRRLYAKWLLIAMGAQLAVVDVIFLAYCVGNDWNVPTSAIDIFMGSTIVQVFSVVVVITRYLFPTRDVS